MIPEMMSEYRTEVMQKLISAGMETEIINTVLAALDNLDDEFEVTKKETALVPGESTAIRVLVEFLACKSVEGMSEETLKNYRYILSHFLLNVGKSVEAVTPMDIRRYLYNYQQCRHVSNRTLDGIRTRISGFFKWCKGEGRIQNDPTATIGTIKYTVTPRRALTQIDLEQIRKKLAGHREKAIVELLYSTGCRVSELANLKRDDIDWNQNTVKIFGKGGKHRISYLNAKAQVALKDYLDSREDHSEYVIVSERKPYGKMSRHGIEHIIGEISNRTFYLTGKRFTPHVFRHTTATTALQNGMPIHNISKMLGHAQIETTMIYAETNMADVQRDHMRYVV